MKKGSAFLSETAPLMSTGSVWYCGSTPLNWMYLACTPFLRPSYTLEKSCPNPPILGASGLFPNRWWHGEKGQACWISMSAPFVLHRDKRLPEESVSGCLFFLQGRHTLSACIWGNRGQCTELSDTKNLRNDKDVLPVPSDVRDLCDEMYFVDVGRWGLWFHTLNKKSKLSGKRRVQC